MLGNCGTKEISKIKLLTAKDLAAFLFFVLVLKVLFIQTLAKSLSTVLKESLITL